jgi:hypothetical protein
MLALGFVFLGLFIYGLIISHLGGALLSLGMVGFMYYASKRFAAQDAAYAADPRNAPKPPCKQAELDQAGVECAWPKDLP